MASHEASSEHEGGKHKHKGGHPPGGHGGGGHEEHEGAPEWLISFADNVTLMMGFFVILWAMSIKDAKSGGGTGEGSQGGIAVASQSEWHDAAIAIRAAFNNPVDINSLAPHEQLLVQRLRQRMAEGDGEALQEGQRGRRPGVEIVRKSDYYGDGGLVRFEPGSVELSDAARTAALEICQRLRGRRWIIEVRGHAGAAETAELADHGAHLSYQRAAEVGGLFAANGIPWRRMRLVACGDTERVASTAYNAADDAENRRVEVFTTDELMQEYLP